MPDNIIETRALSYYFGSQQVLKDVTLQVPKGAIFGFLGPNGAGKTTTIKILLNLLRADSSMVHLFGKPLNENRIESLRRMGSLVEQPALYGHLSGWENMKARAMLLGVSDQRIEKLLELVELKHAIHKKAGKYSLGMKQRLGIALALLSDPELLLLDEPSNGLDPNGIIEIRKLIIRLAQDEGKTVFVSSHLLAEVEKMATHVGIIHKGIMRFQGTVKDLHEVNAAKVHIEVDKLAEAKEVLHAKGITTQLTEAGLLEMPYTSPSEMAAVNALLVQGGIAVSGLSKQRKDLESLFLHITDTNE